MSTLVPAILPVTMASAGNDRSQAAGDNEVFGSGPHLFSVMVTMQTTAYRFIQVRADDLERARAEALSAARDQQGAHFVLNEGNHLSLDDLHVNAVYDGKGEEIWNDDPTIEDEETAGQSPSI